jgi:hypothetical protein
LKIVVPTTFLGRRRMITLNRWWKKENGLDVCNFLKEWKLVGIMLGA